MKLAAKFLEPQRGREIWEAILKPEKNAIARERRRRRLNHKSSGRRRYHIVSARSGDCR